MYNIEKVATQSICAHRQEKHVSRFRIPEHGQVGYGGTWA